MSESEQQSFLAEARIVARLKHPHIIHILEFGVEENEVPYLVMNYTPNGTLRQRFPPGRPVPLTDALPILRQIASALQYAHDQNLIHRDIKPENLLLGEQNEIFLSDFGIATQVRSSRSQTLQEITGTVIYMAPEQLQGRPRPASDQYSLAIVAYEWLTGRRPFQGSNYLEIATKHLQTPPPSLREMVPTLPPAVETTVLTALAKDPHQRYARITDFVAALEIAHQIGQYRSPKQFPLHTSHSQSPMATTHISTPSVPVISPTVAAHDSRFDTPIMTPPTLVAGPTTTPPQGTSAASISPLVSRRGLLVGVCATTIALSAGALWWNYGRSAQGNSTGSHPDTPPPYLVQARSLRVYNEHIEGVVSVAWSPKGSHLISGGDDNTVRLWEAATGNTLWSQDVQGRVTDVAWSPDSRYIASGAMEDSNSVRIWDVTTIHQPTQYRQSGDLFSWGRRPVAWSSDSQQMAVAAQNPAVWNIQSSETPTRYVNSNWLTLGDVNALAWSADNKRIATAETNGYVRIWRLDGDKQHAAYTLQGANEQLSISWSAKSNLIVIGAEKEVALWDVDTNSKEFSQIYTQFSAPVAWSPNGKRCLRERQRSFFHGNDLGSKHRQSRLYRKGS
ncbi:serine/threonine-protein kinase [Ktedonobacter robiniae]|uniref:non-specific serine/threonine protein kinase n=1 Tax=Ktedonobacter robiniae TaxID=2778365 RepID=A0ABQ3V4N5_9CHLR|nr:serine/threonine-protein kinase [Ktedonobacter robiniae]GHO59850.1 hypothetical protein KSB_83250 [Ktedonobacter robiniae]